MQAIDYNVLAHASATIADVHYCNTLTWKRGVTLHVSCTIYMCTYTFMHHCYYIYVVNCSSLGNPNNGMISCLLGDDGVPSYEDTCNLTCNTGNELTGSDTRTCQSNGSWSGTKSMCERGAYANHFFMCYNKTIM